MYVFGVLNTGESKKQKNYVYSWSVSKLMKNNFSQTPNTNPTEETHEENYTMPHHNQIDKNQW